jgi:hypothetical protein
MTKDEALRLALEALEMFCEHGAILRPIETRDAIKAALEAKDKPWTQDDMAYRPNGLPQEFIKHEVELPEDWSEWVCPDPDEYFMKCCDCGLVHEVQYRVARYGEGDYCELVNDKDVQAQFRMRRRTTLQQEKNDEKPCGLECDCTDVCKQDDYKALWQQMCERCDELDKKLAQPEHEPVAWKWHQAPVKTSWGDGMVVADLAIDKDHTASIYCERDQTAKVEAMFTQPQQEAKDEPVAWANMRDDGVTPVMLSISQHPEDRANWMNPVPLYTTPPQRKPLTDEEMKTVVEQELVNYWDGEYIDTTGARDCLTKFARAIEAAHSIKGEA